MLRLKNITKTYTIGDTSQTALDGINICFRKSEFVSVLGQSGSGKTTLLNIIGGLDQYTSGDLIINGKSTKEYRDGDWDAYRNHSVGFVFQSYNLIPHQSVLSNVELALTLSGVSKAERRRRAIEALNAVGLGEHIHKKPNQMSGGQMQRVSIARALINDPDILLADEPTGALDSETSIQVMELLKNIAKDRLVIMVTHNPELAQRYSTRIVKLFDGCITDDTDPFDDNSTTPVIDRKEQKKRRKEKGARKKRSMSLFTALSLSLNNLMTKKGRTFLTSFAGSIGIIGIALILSVSTGFQAYIDRVQEDTLSSYPITIEAESVDMSSLITSLAGTAGKNESDHELDAVYESQIMYELLNTMNSADVNANNLTKLKDYLESNDELNNYLSAIKYSYDVDFNIYTKDTEGTIVKSDISDLFGMNETQSAMSSSMMSSFSSMNSYSVWEELLSNQDGDGINSTLMEQYDVLAGRWPEAYNEIVLVVDENNEINDMTLYALGLKSSEEMTALMSSIQTGEEIDTENARSWSYDEILDMSFKLIPSCEYYQQNADGTYVDLSQTDTGLDYMYNNSDIGVDLKVTGIIRASDEAVASMLSGSVGYTHALTDYVLEKAYDSDIVKSQLADPSVDVITGLPFPSSEENQLTDSEKAAAFTEYAAGLSTDEKAQLFVAMSSIPPEEYLQSIVDSQLSSLDRTSLQNMLIESYAENMGVTDTQSIEDYFSAMDDDSLFSLAEEGIRSSATDSYAVEVKAQLAQIPAESLAAQLSAAQYTDEQYAAFYDDLMPQTVSDSTYEDNLALLGYASPDSPSAINLYAISFEDKDEISRIIDEYNESVSEEDAITYTDYVALLMSSVTTIINAISYVLIAFVAISLVVSSIMIGIITYISVLERTKEIGILRSIGASKRDVSRVFNAETLIVGLCAGLIGILFTLLLLLPINLILHHLTGIEMLSAQLPVAGAVILVVISMLLTFIAGLVPSGIAAKKNPVEALRTE